jgi:hypothetical protein
MHLLQLSAMGIQIQSENLRLATAQEAVLHQRHF